MPLEGSSKMPLTRIIKQHKKLLHRQNPWHESKPWRLSSADEELPEGHLALSPPMPDTIIVIPVWCRPATCCCTSVQAGREHTSSSVTEVVLMAPFLNQHGVTYDHIRWCGKGTNCQHPYSCCRTASSITIASSPSSSSSSEMDSYCLAAVRSLSRPWPSPWVIIAAS